MPGIQEEMYRMLEKQLFAEDLQNLHQESTLKGTQGEAQNREREVYDTQ